MPTDFHDCAPFIVALLAWASFSPSLADLRLTLDIMFD